MASKCTSFTATLTGIRPILFDRYGGDNKTKLDAKDKGYRNANGEYGIPTLNLFSMLAAQNTPSVAKLFYGKQGREVALGVMSFCDIQAIGDDPNFAVIKSKEGDTYTATDKRVRVINHIARLNKGVPNPKERPMLPTGWVVCFRFELQENAMLNEATLRRMIEQGGIIGLGTFRPIFGRYSVVFS